LANSHVVYLSPRTALCIPGCEILRKTNKDDIYFGIHYQWVVIAFFCIFFLVGIFIYRDYGMAFDAVFAKLTGEQSINYIFHQNMDLFSSVYKEYGAAFELLITSLYTLLNLQTDVQIYFFRHLIIFCSFFTGTIFFYLLIKLRFKSWKIGLFGALLLILSPRIFESAFVNSRDIPFMVFTIISAYTLFKLDEKMRVRDAIIHGAVTGFLIAIRPVGLFMVGLSGLVFLIKLMVSIREQQKIIGRILLSAGSFLVFTVGFTIMWWPWLWPDPIGNFVYAFSSFAQYSAWKGVVLYMGEVFEPTNLPWHYTPVWILVTTPLLYSFFALGGLFLWIAGVVRKKIDLRKFTDRIDLAVVTWFILPMIMVAVLHSILYSGWRHMFFIYPAMLYMTITGMVSVSGLLRQTFSFKLPQTLLRGTIILSLIGTTVAMAINHPYESMYFNILAGKNLRSAKYRYGLDFYGLCAKEALDYVLENSEQVTIDILPSKSVVLRSAYLIPVGERSRIRWTGNFNVADYFIGAYTDQREEFVLPGNYQLVYAVERGGADMCVVYKNRDDHIE
jgi:hypothetical protein